MASLQAWPFDAVTDFYAYMMDNADPRSSNWFLMSSPVPTLALSAAYLLVIKLGTNFMKDRKPFELKPLLIIYNLAVVLLNVYIAYELIYNIIAEKMSLWCSPVNQDPTNQHSMRLAKGVWWFYFSKCIEFMDTVFFVLRKKDKQVTFLHLYHHSTMFPLWWMGARWAPGGQSCFSAAINSSIHVIMYSYYMLAALGPKVRPYLWWKRYLTQLQLAQFFFVLITTSTATYAVRQGRCQFFEWMGWANISYMVTMIALFTNFYVQSYIKKRNEAAAAKKQK